jgi:hypothetical protein
MPRRWWCAIAVAALGCAGTGQVGDGGNGATCLSVGVNYDGTQQGVVILTGTSTLDSGLQFVTSLPAVPPDAGLVGATVCGGAPTGDNVLLTAWLDDGGTAPFCSLPLTALCTPPLGAPQTSQVVDEVGGKTTSAYLLISDPDGGS